MAAASSTDTSINTADLAAAIQLRSTQSFHTYASLSSNARLPLIDPMLPSFQSTVQSATYRERIEMTGVPSYGGQTVTEIPNRGDFLTKLSICFTLPVLMWTEGTYANYTNAIAHVLPKRVELMLGEALLDRLYGDFMECEDQLTIKDGKWKADCLSKGRYESYLLPSSQGDGQRTQTKPATFTCDLPFSFTKSLSLALPLMSIPFSRLTLRIAWSTFDRCVIFDGDNLPPFMPMMDAWLEAEYTKLEPTYSIPRYSFNVTDLRYIIQQRKYVDECIPAGATSIQVSLDSIVAPCAAIVFFLRDSFAAENNDWFNFSLIDSTPVLSTARLTCDGTDIFIEREEGFYRLEEPAKKAARAPNANVYLMSFTSDFTETNTSSGSMDLKQIRNTCLWLKLTGQQEQCQLRVMALCYNILAIKEGRIYFKDIY